MKKRVFVYIMSLSILFLIVSCGFNDEEEAKEYSEAEKINVVKSVMADGAILSNIRPAENELSEQEILLKVTDVIIKYGYNSKESADEVDPKLYYSKVQTPDYVYSTQEGSSSLGGYTIYTVDENDCVVASLTCNANEDRELNNFVGSWGPCTYIPTHHITKAEAKELIQDQMPNKDFTDPALISTKINSPFYEEYWYVATVDKTESATKGLSKALSDNPSKVEEYLIDCGIAHYNGSSSKSAKGLQSSGYWDGIYKVNKPLGYYKIIEANKTVYDNQSKSLKALDAESPFASYRGQKLSSVYSGFAEVSKVTLK